MRISLLGLAALAGCAASSAPPERPAAVVPNELHRAVQRLTSRRGERVEATLGPHGIKVFQIQQGLGQVVVARTNRDGSVSARCVDAADDSAAAPAPGNTK